MPIVRSVQIFVLFALVFGFVSPSPSLFGISAARAEGHAKAEKKKSGDHKPKGEGEKKGEGEEAGPHPDFEYMDMKPLVLPIVTEKGVTQQVSLMVSLEVPYGGLEEVSSLEPRLADAYLQDLYGALGAGGIMMRAGVIDVVVIKQRLTAVTDKVLGKDKVHGVLLQVLQQRPM